jgi:hypothetical protein
MAFKLKRTLEFNKFTLGLAAAGLAYAATVSTPSEFHPHEHVSFGVKCVATLNILAFAVSVLMGTLIIGRATKLTNADDDLVSDSTIETLGRIHSAALVLGLLLAGSLMLDRIWDWF